MVYKLKGQKRLFCIYTSLADIMSQQYSAAFHTISQRWVFCGQ